MGPKERGRARSKDHHQEPQLGLCNVTRAQEYKSTCSPKHTRLGHPLLTKFKGREMSGGENKGFTAGRPPLGRQWTSIPKTVSQVLTVRLGLCEDNVGQRPVRTCRWAVQARQIVALGSIHQHLAGVRGQVSPRPGSFSSCPECLPTSLLLEFRHKL